MLNSKFDAWCDAATAKIRYGGDRNAVAAELRAHLEDRYDALTASGLSHAEATAKALEAMGDAREIAPQLGKIYSPWLGWLLSILRLVGIMALAGAVLLLLYSGHWEIGATEPEPRPMTLRSVIVTDREIVNYVNPVGQAQWDGCYLQVKEAALCPDGYYFVGPEIQMLVEISWQPWENGFGVEEYIWAKDSQGNVYRPLRYHNEKPDEPCVSCNIYSSGEQGKGYLWVKLGNWDPDAQWVELRYDRDGRDMVLRVDLTGGGQT